MNKAKVTAVERRSFRPGEVAKRNGCSKAFVYAEINAGRLRAKKSGAATFITAEAETDWLDLMPAFPARTGTAA